jgi:hypothetical protein
MSKKTEIKQGQKRKRKMKGDKKLNQKRRKNNKTLNQKIASFHSHRVPD